jgi:hypothetical protein
MKSPTGAILPPDLTGHLPGLAHPIIIIILNKGKHKKEKEKKRRALFNYEARTLQYNTNTSTLLM